MTKCCRSIVTRVSRESLIGEAPFTNQEISQYPKELSNRIDAIFPSWDDRLL